MAVGKILNQKEESLLVASIAKAEENTTGEIRVHIANKVSRRGPIADAATVFRRLGMHRTEQRNGVLIFVAIKSHQLACIGDKGIHERVGDAAWQSIVDQLRDDFARGDYFIGLKKSVEASGALLAHHFPSDGRPSANVLDNSISSD